MEPCKPLRVVRGTRALAHPIGVYHPSSVFASVWAEAAQAGRFLPPVNGAGFRQDGRVQGEPGAATADWLPVYQAATIAERAAALPADLRLELPTPLRVKARGAFIETIDPPALVQALCWRLNALATFHGDGPWPVDYRPLIAQAQAITVEQAQVRWVD